MLGTAHRLGAAEGSALFDISKASLHLSDKVVGF